MKEKQDEFVVCVRWAGIVLTAFIVCMTILSIFGRG